MSNTSLHDRMRSLKRRLLAVGLSASMGWGLAAAILLLLLCMWLDLVLELSPVPRIVCGAACAALGLIMAGGIAASVWRRGAPAAMARRLDRAAAAGGQILAGVDLLLRPMTATTGGSSALTAGLAQLTVNRAATLAATVPFPTAVPARPILGPLVALASLGLAGAVIVLSVPRLALTQWARFVDPFGDHPPYSRIELDVNPGDTKVVYGGTLDIRATPHGETVDNIDLIVRAAGAAEEKLPMFPEPGGAWRATLTHVTADADYVVRARSARSRRFNITVVTVPKLQGVRFRITPPPYTHRPPLEGPLPPAGLAALPGTLVQVWAKSNRPLSGGALTADAPQGVVAAGAATQAATASAFALQPVAPGSDEVTGQFFVRSAGNFNLKVSDISGQASTEQFTAPVTVLRDERPFVRILDPKPDSFATPETTLNINILAEDDYGVARVELFHTLNESRATSTVVPVPRTEPTQFPVSVPLPLSAYGLSPGDVVKLYARVLDNDPAGAKSSESPVVTVKIISEEQMQQMLLAREGLETLLSKYEMATRKMEAASERIDQLRKELEKAAPDSEVAKELADQLNKEAEKLADDARELAQLAKEDLPFDLDHAMKDELEKAAQAMKDAAAEVKKLAGQPHLTAGAAKEGLAKAQEHLGGAREEFKEEAAEPLDYLAKIYPLIEDQARFIDLWERQKDLAQRMDSLIGHDNEDDPKLKSRMRDLQGEQERIRKDLRSLLDDIETHVAELPADPRLDGLRESAGNFVKTVRNSTAADDMAATESALAEFLGSRSATAALLAAETLEKFIGKCDSMGQEGQACLKFKPKLSAGMGETIEQLLEAEGLSLGKGKTGSGAGGYSARRNSLRNVGLYGRLPVRGKESRAGGGHAQHGTSADGRGNGVPGAPGDANVENRLKASGQSGAAVPDRYKRRVGEYFQRVSDELDEDKK